MHIALSLSLSSLTYTSYTISFCWVSLGHENEIRLRQKSFYPLGPGFHTGDGRKGWGFLCCLKKIAGRTEQHEEKMTRIRPKKCFRSLYNIRRFSIQKKTKNNKKRVTMSGVCSAFTKSKPCQGKRESGYLGLSREVYIY